MSANSSNASLLPPSSPSSSISMISLQSDCLTSTPGTVSLSAFIVVSVLVLLPLYVFVLYLGRRRWREQRRGSTISHSDLFTYHIVVIELMSVFGSVVLCCGVHADLPPMIMAAAYLLLVNVCGQMFFHLLTCVERYLAVVHPVTYLNLKKAKWIRVRNVTVGCVWLLCFALASLLSVGDHVSIHVIYICVIAFILIVISFCSVSVLCVVIRPGPGEGGGDRQRVDQSKLRAFHTIAAILGVLLVRLGGGIIAGALYASPQLSETEKCSMLMPVLFFFLPSSLVLPLLFLQRAGKLQCCKKNRESGTDQIRMENNQ